MRLTDRPSDSEEAPGVRMWPVFFAAAYHGAVLVVNDDVLVDRQRQRHGDRGRPDGTNDDQTTTRRQTRAQRVHDRKVSVDSDRHRRQRRHVDTDAHDHRYNVTQHLKTYTNIYRIKGMLD